MSSATHPEKFVWLLGQGRYQRLYMQYWLMTSLVYVLILLLEAYAAAVGLLDASLAPVLRSLVMVVLLVFFVALRSGWSQRFSDPALTTPQMASALVLVSVTYVLGPNLRTLLVMIIPLILLFGAFTSSPLQCWMMALLAALLQGLSVAVITSPLVNHLFGLPVANPQKEWFEFMGCLVVFAMTAAMAGRLSQMRYRLRSQKKELNQALAHNQVLVRQDSLTSLPNRRHAMELLANEEQRALRQQMLPCVAMLDIDHFKRINDTFGHAAGDDLLRLFATHATTALRTIDVLTRWGGEEFMLIMPGTSLPEALQGIERLRKQLAQPDVWRDHPDLRVTFSAGVAFFHTEETLMQTVERADAALYAAKQQGRNRTVAADAVE